MLGISNAHPEAVLGDGAGYDLTIADVQPQLAAGGDLERAFGDAARDGTWRGESALRKRDGREIPVEQVLLAHRAADGSPRYFSAIMRDITDRKQAEAALRALSLVDELTGLYNRRGFTTLAAQALARARERGAPALVFYMDMDGFKGINDVHGHAEGDEALKAVADVLRRTFRESDVVARLGGDEFVVFATHGAGQPSDEIARAVEARLGRHLDEANRSLGRPYRLAMSVGVGCRPAAGDGDAAAPEVTLDALLGAADAAMYDVKARRRAAR
jgi:diguanylate cyclase (GGDEF)-like protein